MDYSNLTNEELYNLLSDSDKIIADFFINYPKIDESQLNKIGLSGIAFTNERNAMLAFKKMCKQRMRTIFKDLKKSNSTDHHLAEKQFAIYKRLQDPVVYAIRKNNIPLAWYLAKNNYTSKIEPKAIFSFLMSNKIERLKIATVLPLKKSDTYDKMAIYQILRRMIKEPENEKQILEFYYAFAKSGYCSINQMDNVKYWYNRFLQNNEIRLSSLTYTDGIERYILHRAILRHPESLPLLLKFKDLDVNLENRTKNEWHGADNSDPENGNTPIMQLLRWADPRHLKLVNSPCCCGVSQYEADINADYKQTMKEYDVEESNAYIDEFIKRDAILDYKNKNGESVVMTAIHHFHVHGVEVCQHLLYPEILLDMEKLHGRSTWAELPPKICEILSAKFPDMVDSMQIPYKTYIEDKEIYDQKCRDQIRVVEKFERRLAYAVSSPEDTSHYDFLSDLDTVHLDTVKIREEQNREPYSDYEDVITHNIAICEYIERQKMTPLPDNWDFDLPF